MAVRVRLNRGSTPNWIHTISVVVIGHQGPPFYLQGFVLDETSLALIALHDVLLKVEPVRPGPLVPAQHVLNHILDLLGVGLAKPVNAVLEGLPMDPGQLVPVALVLVLEQPSLQDNHSQSPDITLVVVKVGDDEFLLEGSCLLGRQIQVRGGSFSQAQVVVGLGAGRKRV